MAADIALRMIAACRSGGHGRKHRQAEDIRRPTLLLVHVAHAYLGLSRSSVKMSALRSRLSVARYINVPTAALSRSNEKA